MKKWLVTLCAVSMAAVITGCGGSEEKVIEGNVATNGAQTSKDADVKEEVKEQETKVEESKEVVEKGYIFKQGDVSVIIDADAAPIVAALGEPVSYFEAASCAFDGLDKIYTYNSFEIDTYPTEGKDYISAIILMDDSITTAEGIAIGETKARVEEVYGTDYTEQGSMLVYEKDGMKLSFIFTDDMITSIQYNSTVLEE